MGFKTKYWLDTEFMEDGKTIELLSIGIVCEDGREFYVENAEANMNNANDWVKKNVIPHLWQFAKGDRHREANRWEKEENHTGGLWRPEQLKHDLRTWINAGNHPPEFWGYFCDYDWVVICQLFGTMLDLPGSWPMFCLDLKQEAYLLGSPDLPEQSATEHHALEDARWNREVHTFLNTMGKAFVKTHYTKNEGN